MVIQWKGIKPTKLRSSKVRLELLNAVGRQATAIKKDYARTVKSWAKKPEFEVQQSLKGGPSVLVGTDDVVYLFVDEGTRPHIIAPKGPWPLRFQTGYKAKTSPGVLDSGSGGKFGPERRALVVHHPGTEARGFSAKIAAEHEKLFKRAMERAMVRAARASGHGG